MSSKETHLAFGRGILEHRYRYYRLNDPVLTDAMYDLMERDYKTDAAIYGDQLGLLDMVDFPETSECVAAASRVEAGTDVWGTWFRSMLPTWDRLGPPKYYRFHYAQECITRPREQSKLCKRLLCKYAEEVLADKGLNNTAQDRDDESD